jgi:ribosomal protein S10
MVHLKFKSYSILLIQKFYSILESSKYKLLLKNLVHLPVSLNTFTVKKSPHVNGRFKETYQLSTFSSGCSIGPLNEKELRNFLGFLKYFRVVGLGINVDISP